MLAQREAKNQAECYEEVPLVITTPGGSYKFVAWPLKLALPAMLLNIEVAAKATAEKTKRPEIKLDIPAMNSAPTRMSLFKSFISLLNSKSLNSESCKLLCLCYSVVVYYTR